MKASIFKNLLLSVISVFIFLLGFEGVTRIFIKPSDTCYGVFLGRELPPFKILPREYPLHTDNNKWYRKIIINGKKITTGDLFGILEEDKLLGYAPKENTVSTNGWWQSNNLGARSRYDTAKDTAKNKTRILIFGESFANSCTVSQEETWPFFLGGKSENVEVINFGVTGYSMAQSFLRYRKIKNEIDYDVVILMFVPSADLWRDINTIRYLPDRWKSYTIMPRFIIEKGEIKLIKSPYETVNSFYESNRKRLDKRVIDHLRKYDCFYFRTEYESPLFIGDSIIYKLFARKYAGYMKKQLTENLMKTGSEAMNVTNIIFKTMNEEVKKDGKKLILVYLPETSQETRRYVEDPLFKDQWDKMVLFNCKGNLIYIDLMKNLPRYKNQLDKGYDGTHYGPKANRIIADLIWENLRKLNLSSD